MSPEQREAIAKAQCEAVESGNVAALAGLFRQAFDEHENRISALEARLGRAGDGRYRPSRHGLGKDAEA